MTTKDGNDKASERKAEDMKEDSGLQMLMGASSKNQFSDAIDISKCLVIVIDSKDSLAYVQDFTAIKQGEVEGLKNKVLWKAVPKSKVSMDAIVPGGTFVMTLKSLGAQNIIAKVRFVAQGIEDQYKPFIVHDTSTINAFSVQVLLLVTTIYIFVRFLMTYRNYCFKEGIIDPANVF